MVEMRQSDVTGSGDRRTGGRAAGRSRRPAPSRPGATFAMILLSKDSGGRLWCAPRSRNSGVDGKVVLAAEERCRRKNPATTRCRCSFCNKSQRDVKKLIAGPTVYICDECVDICLDIIAEDRMHEPQQEARLSRSRKRSKSSSTSTSSARSGPRRSSPSRSTTTTSGSTIAAQGARRTSSCRSRTSC